MKQKSEILSRLEEAKRFLGARISNPPKIALVLGSGLGGLVAKMVVEQTIDYAEIPHFPPSTVEGHSGKLIVGTLNGVRVACLQGRVHYYEGYRMDQVVFPTRLLALFGVKAFILTNAAGGLQPDMRPQDLVLLTDHINATGNNPLIGPNIEELGPRFPDMTTLYDRKLRELLLAGAAKSAVPLRQGVYVALSGPSFETPTEVRMYRQLGADVSGMSTVPEAIALGHMGKRVAAISFVTNQAAGITGEALTHSEVIENAAKGLVKLTALLTEALPLIENEVGR